MHADRRMQRRRRLPGPVAHAADKLSGRARGLQWDGPAVASQYIAIRHKSRRLDLHALQRGVDIACGSADSALLAHDVPGLERLPQLDLDAARSEGAVLREAEFHMRSEPFRPQWIACSILLRDDIGKVLGDEVGQHEAIVQL